MKKFVFIYFGGTESVKTAENVQAYSMQQIMADWGKWFEELGPALVDGGSPFNSDGQSVTLNGAAPIMPADMPATGYTIVNAESMEAAVELAKGCPSHKHMDGKAVVQVYEAMPM